jgi:hypothetical protein
MAIKDNIRKRKLNIEIYYIKRDRFYRILISIIVVFVLALMVLSGLYCSQS